jgi:hypothetical protein
MQDFRQVVTEAFKSLLERGLLQVESSDYDPQAFGNAVVVLMGQNLRVRMVRDRGETFALAASKLDPDNWFPLQRVIHAVGVSDPPPEGLLGPDEAASIVERYVAELEKGLDSGNVSQTKKRLAELGRFAFKRMMDQAKRTK